MGIEHLSRHDDDKHRRLIHQLWKSGRPEDRRLARILAECTADHPCRSAACIHCGRDFQRFVLDFVRREIDAPARRDVRWRVSRFTIVPNEGVLAPEELTASACRQVVADVTAALVACGVSTYALSLDVSFNEDPAGKAEACVHVHGFRPNWFAPNEKKGLKANFPKSAKVHRPVHVEQLDRDDNGRLYIFKPDRVRRVSHDDGRRPDRYTLRPWQAVALAHVEHELGFEYRLVTNGIDENAVDDALDAFYRARDGP